MTGLIPAHAGKTWSLRDAWSSGGLIPAHAGKTFARPSTRRPLAAHPRSRGENRQHVRRHINSVGSSPLTRGKPGGEVLSVDEMRLIPAHAGKTG